MNKEYFNNNEYVKYLKKYCNPNEEETKQRVIGAKELVKVLDIMQIKPDDKVLEIGCGIGRVMKLIRDRYNTTPIGCDISDCAITEAKKLFPKYAKDFFVSHSDKIDLDDSSINNIIFWGVFEMTNQKYTMLEVSRLLTIGGKALISGVKNIKYKIDDKSSLLAKEAYINKNFPITYTDIAKFENFLNFLGFEILNKLVFVYKDDVANFKYIDNIYFNGDCSDIYYVIEKKRKVELDYTFQFKPNGERYV